jgi:mannobiose 2-epimerase
MGGFILGYKSMNAHIHILEALAALYHASQDALVKQRLAEVLAIVRDRVAVEPGCLNLWLTEDWRAVPDHDSYGHDIETGFLLLEAAEVLGQPNDPKTLRMARMLVDHTLDWAWDEKNGGFCERGFAFSKPFDTKKVWWTQVEGLHSLLLMHEHYGQETNRYWEKFLQQWEFIKAHQIDSEFPGLFGETEADGKPIGTDKGNNWKAGYHDGRSFLLIAERLKKLAKD